MAESSRPPVGSGDRVTAVKRDADYIFYELTRSICPECRRPIDAHIVLRDGKVFMRKRCPLHGQFEALIYADAQAYTSQARFNKPGTMPLGYSSPIERGCPHDCGLCPTTSSMPAWGSSRSTAPATCSAPYASPTPAPASA